MIARARPLLGTLVHIEAQTLDEGAIAAAFAAVGRVHAAMSFHAQDSELSRLNRGAPGQPIPVGDDLAAVLQLALEVAAASEGAFDPVCAARVAVDGGALPRPDRACDPLAGWRDVELEAIARVVTLHRPLWIDLGGVAKGWAVDRAVDTLQGLSPAGCVDAGGDLRVWGDARKVVLNARAPQHPTAVVEIEDGAVAASGGLEPPWDSLAPGHVDGRTDQTLANVFAAVVAPSCAAADALTKVVLALGNEAAEVLDAFGAVGRRLSQRDGWTVVGTARP